MANQFYNSMARDVLDGIEDLSAVTLKAILVNATRVENADDVFIDEAGADDVIDGEISATNYTGGFGGAGRQALANVTITVDNTDDEAVLDADDITWTGLGGASNDTITAVEIVIEKTADTDSKLVCRNELSSSTTTNGSDVTIQWDAEGIINLNT